LIGIELVTNQKQGHYMAILRITGNHGHRLSIRSDCAYVISLKISLKESGDKESEDKTSEDKESERGKIICKTSFVDLEAGDWLIVYPPVRTG
jgi:hypothetical protein